MKKTPGPRTNPLDKPQSRLERISAAIEAGKVKFVAMAERLAARADTRAEADRR